MRFDKILLFVLVINGGTTALVLGRITFNLMRTPKETRVNLNLYRLRLYFQMTNIQFLVDLLVLINVNP